MTETATNSILLNQSVYDRGIAYPSDDEIKMIFVSSCIESVAAEIDKSPSDVYKRMVAVNLIHDYILKHYDVIHTESRENITKDIIEVLNLWEKKGGDTDA